MPLVYQQNVNAHTKLGVWHIKEPENFFLKKVSLQNGIANEHKRLQHLAGRYLLPELFEGFPLELINIADTKKPFLIDEAFHFSISHCGDYAAAIVSTANRVGVDVEIVNEKIGRIFHKFISEEECLLLPEESVNRTATLMWSVKESVFKWYGAGEVDFKKHIIIKEIQGEVAGIVHVEFLKTNPIKLSVHFLFFNNNFLSWVVTDVEA